MTALRMFENWEFNQNLLGSKIKLNSQGYVSLSVLYIGFKLKVNKKNLLKFQSTIFN